MAFTGRLGTQDSQLGNIELGVEGAAFFNGAPFVATAAFGAAAIEGGAVFVGAPFTATAAFGAATLDGGATIPAAPLTATAAWGAAVMEGNTRAILAVPWVATAAFGAPPLTGGARISPTPFAATAAWGAATMDGGGRFSGSPFASTAAWLEAIIRAPHPPDTAANVEVIITAGGKTRNLTAAACDTLKLSYRDKGGDYDCSLEYPFTGEDELPPDYAKVTLQDSDGPFWFGRIVTASIPEWNGCDGKVSIKALGYFDHLSDTVFPVSTIYGPRPNGKPILALRADDALTHAITQRCQELALSFDPESIPDAGLLQDETPDFLGQTAAAVVNHISGLFSYLATPYFWEVRAYPGFNQPVFFWRTFDPAPRCWVRLANGAKLGIERSAADVYNRGVVPWGKNQPIVIPDTVSYDRIPIIRDKPINVTGQVTNPDYARSLAQGVLANFNTERSGWRYTIRIPTGCVIETDGAQTGDLSHTIRPWRLRAGQSVRIADLNPGVFGPPGRRPPIDHWITQSSCDLKSGEVTLTCGEVVNQTASIKAAAARTSTVADAFAHPRVTHPNMDANKLRLIGPQAPDVTPSGGHGSPVGYGAGAISKEHEQWMPETMPPLPPPLTYQINDTLTTGRKGLMVIPPLRIVKWFIWASQATTFAVNIVLRSTGQTLNIPVALSAAMERTDVLVTPAINLSRAVDALFFDVTTADTDEDLKWVVIGLWVARYYPTFPGKPTLSAPST